MGVCVCSSKPTHSPSIDAVLVLRGRRERIARGLDEPGEDLVVCAGRGIESSGGFGEALKS